MPAPSRARAMTPPRQISASTPLYSASPPQTPPSTRLVLLRYRCGRGGTAARGGGSGVGGSAVGGPGGGGGLGGGGLGGGGRGVGESAQARSLLRTPPAGHGGRSRSGAGPPTRPG